MKHPKSENCIKLADTFIEIIAKFPKGKLNMMEGSVCDLRDKSKPHPCGTVHCHAGWAMVGLNPKKTNAAGAFLSYHAGVAEIDKLMFNAQSKQPMACYSLIALWAQHNPKLWGNYDGGSMFISSRAFAHATKRPFGAANLKHIADHWREVGKRLAKLEKANAKKNETSKF